MDIVEYKEEFGEFKFPEGFAEKLVGKSIEEQMEFFRITESVSLAKSSYGNVNSERINDYSFKLDEYSDCKGLVVKAGVIVGVMMYSWFDSKPVCCFPYKGVCTYYACDEDGAGCDEREDYAFLICI